MDLEKFNNDLVSTLRLLKTSSLRLSLENFHPSVIEQYALPPSEESSKGAKNLFFNETRQLRRIISDIYHNNDKLYVLSGRQFETIIAELLASQGFGVELTQQTKDGGYDIIALSKINNDIPLKFLVECKKYDSSRK